MTAEDLRRLGALLAARVKEKSGADDSVAMFTTARLLDQVNAEIGDLEHAPRRRPPTGKPPRAKGRRVFVKG